VHLATELKGDALKFSYIGFTSQEVKVRGFIADIRLIENQQSLDELVVVVYGVGTQLLHDKVRRWCS